MFNFSPEHLSSLVAVYEPVYNNIIENGKIVGAVHTTISISYDNNKVNTYIFNKYDTREDILKYMFRDFPIEEQQTLIKKYL